MAGICLFGMKEEPYGYWPDGKGNTGASGRKLPAENVE